MYKRQIPALAVGAQQDLAAVRNDALDHAGENIQDGGRTLGSHIFPNDNGIELVRSLKGRVHQYAVTNGSAVAQERKLSVSGLDKLFDGIFISDKVGAEKPATEFFDRVFEQIPENREDVIIVGDSLTSDIRGANNAGIACCWSSPERSPGWPPSISITEVTARSRPTTGH